MNKFAGKKRFGTDGIRGLANVGPLNIDEVIRLGEATAVVFKKKLNQRCVVGLGWDTRISSPAIAHALAAGLSSGGVKVIKFGVIPTPAVACLTRKYRLEAGIVISASHNPAEDNGIKYFNAQGGKLPDKLEQALEKVLDQAAPIKQEQGIYMGMIEEVYGDAALGYHDLVLKKFASSKLSGLKIIADLAHGATCRTVPSILADLGIQAKVVGDQPNGININHQCGSLYPQQAARLVTQYQADAGLAFDGDGDRVMVIAEDGSILNGDRMMTILANYYKKKRKLTNRTVVATVMTNLGLERFLAAQDINLLRTQVGDRYVSDKMQQVGAILGGEQSGHILLPRLSSTGDGLITALEVLAVMRAEGQPLSQLSAGWDDYPQLLMNVPVTSRPELMRLPKVSQTAQAASAALGDQGRFNCRYSGTELLARVMVEAADKKAVTYWADQLATAIEQEIGIGKKRRSTWLTSV